LLDLRVKLSDDFACCNHIADIDEPLDHASVEAKGEAGLVLGADERGEGLRERAARSGACVSGSLHFTARHNIL
jgi:hypothetical protein